MESLPSYVIIFFILTTIITLLIFFRAMQKPLLPLAIILAWLALQAGISKTGFYTITNTLPPRFMLTIAPPLLLIAILFVTVRGRNFIDSLDMKALSLLHVIRIPVEITLLWLSIYKLVPAIMTFEGRNFDILSGITAPLIWYFGFVKNRMGNTGLLLWNFICLGLLLNIVITAILAAPFPFQKFGFDQPNIAIFYFPFVWLPSVIVPLVLFSHLVMIRRLLNEKRKLAIQLAG